MSGNDQGGGADRTSSAPSHSPGPWRTADGLVTDVNGDVVLAFVREANAPLIAAAPELLAVARYAAKFSSSAHSVAVEALARIPGEEALLERLGYLVVDGKPSRDAYEAKLARESRR